MIIIKYFIVVGVRHKYKFITLNKKYFNIHCNEYSLRKGEGVVVE